jgi:hypothetical protein
MYRESCQYVLLAFFSCATSIDLVGYPSMIVWKVYRELEEVGVQDRKTGGNFTLENIPSFLLTEQHPLSGIGCYKFCRDLWFILFCLLGG